MEPGSRWGKCHSPSAMQTTKDLMCNAQVTQPTGPVGEEVRYTELFLHVLEVVRVLEIHAGPAFLVSACEPSQLSAVIVFQAEGTASQKAQSQSRPGFS